MKRIPDCIRLEHMSQVKEERARAERYQQRLDALYEACSTLKDVVILITHRTKYADLDEKMLTRTIDDVLNCALEVRFGDE